MSAFLYIDWTLVAAAAAAASVFASVWLTERRESRDIYEAESDRQRRIGKLQTEVSALRGEVERLRNVVLDHAKKLNGGDEHG